METYSDLATWYEAHETCFHGNSVLSVTTRDGSEHETERGLTGGCYDRLINKEFRYWTKETNAIYAWNTG